MGEIAQRTFNLADLFEVVADAAPDRLELVAGYKLPKEFHVLDVLQRTPAGKPDYRWAKTRAVELAS
jgi:acyl-CoA synthetase (AMP-forming)/AMP-acid ligase II